MSLSGLCPTHKEVDRVILTFSFDPASNRAHRIPIEGEYVGRRVKEQWNATRGLCRPYRKANGIRFHANIPVSELIKHVTRAVEASDVALTPLVMETTDGAIVTKRDSP